MSYPIDIQNPKSLQQILSRKEFSQLKLNQKYLSTDSKTAMKANENILDDEIQDAGNLRILSQQQFVKNWISPDTPFLRLLMKHSTGTGKTIGSLSIAMEFMKHYRQMVSFSDTTPSVFVIGFSKHVFTKEILRHPEFGFISHDEMADYHRLKKIADTGTSADKDALSEFESRIKKRLTNKQLGGFFKFFGYKEFFNRLFIFSENTIDKANLMEDEIIEGLADGWITLNYDLIKSAANSLIICDEIHNVYNSEEINNYGIALQTILDLYDSPDVVASRITERIALRIAQNAAEKNVEETEPETETEKKQQKKENKKEKKTIKGSAPENVKQFKLPEDVLAILKNSYIKIVFMSATPINNSPTEIIDLMNLLVPLSRLPNRQKLTKESFFLDKRNLKQGALKQIQDMIRGYVSFFRDDNPKYYPSNSMDGKEIMIPPKVQRQDAKEKAATKSKEPLLTKIPYLKFIRCKMSPLHWKTYSSIYEGTLPPDGQSLTDFVLPNPDGKLGLFRTKEITHSITNATRKWKEQNMIDITKQSVGNIDVDIISGEFMNVKNIGKYSTKYEQVILDAIESIEEDAGKVIIIHQHVKMSGVLFIQEMFRRNGILDEFSNPVENTICVKCGKTMESHKSTKKSSDKIHDFMPVRSIILYGDIDKHSLDVSIEKFNNPDNMFGYNYKFLIGSKMIKEAYDFKAVQHLWIVSPPSNIPAFEQIKGRPIRKNSHIMLPSEKQHVTLRIYVSSVPDGNDLSYEEQRYYDKIKDYLVIQQISKVFNENAIDSVIHRDIIFPEGPKTNKNPDLGTLYFEPSEETFGNGKVSINKTVTTEIFHADYEIEQIIFIIKRLFIEQSPVWRYDDLWEMVKQPPFEIYVNSQTFSEDNFAIALESMIYSTEKHVDVYTTDTLELKQSDIDRLFDHYDKKIVKNGIECQIIFKNGYYMLFPNDNIFNSKSYNLDEYKRDLNRMKQTTQLGLPIVETIGYPEIDLDGWFRYPEKIENTVFNISKYLKTSNVSYNNMKYKFFSRFKNAAIYKLPVTVEVYGLDFHAHLIEDAIKYVFNVLTTNTEQSELHDFYFKMLYFYDKLDMILFADLVEDKYKDYVTKAKIKIPDVHYHKHKYEILKEDHKYNAFLMSSIIKSTGSSPDFNIDRLNAFIDQSGHFQKKMSREPAKSKTAIRKVFSNMLPVGHFLSKSGQNIGAVIPRLYDPVSDSWSQATEFIEKYVATDVENNIIVGYYEKNTTGIDVKFKLRPPIQKIVKHEDSRMIERGSVCSTRKKEELIEIANSLNITLDTMSIKEICDLIKFELMYREIQSRRKAHHEGSSKRVRWFYLHFEQQPE